MTTTPTTKETAFQQGAADERARIGAILTCEAAEGREAQARSLALETDLSPEAAAKVLEASPKASAVLSIEERAQGEAEIGGDGPMAPETAADRAWGKAAKAVRAGDLQPD
ncbi:hypothetical protein A3731_23145 [Roseovarius sp. HI0049]|nr:hypothetical protein A3731_23145 [Roseovarius sp. HI0049]